MFDKEKIRFYLESYQKDLPKFWSDEKYKWEAVDFFQKNWNIESPDFWGMLKLATSKQVNLLSSGMYFPLGMLQEFIEIYLSPQSDISPSWAEKQDLCPGSQHKGNQKNTKRTPN